MSTQFIILLSSNNKLYGQGANGLRQLDPTPTTTYTTFTRIDQNLGISNVQSVHAGGSSTLYRKKDNTFWVIGTNSDGRLCTGNNINPIANLTQITLNFTVADILMTTPVSYFRTPEGSVYVCGSNTGGRMGVGGNSNVPRLLPFEANVTKMAGFIQFTMLLTINGTLYGLGSNTNGVLGIGSIGGTFFIPAEIIFPEPIADVAVGASHTVAIGKSGKAYGWGQVSNAGAIEGRSCLFNTTGATLTGPGFFFTTPQPIITPESDNFTRAFAATSSTHMIDNYGRVWACGLNNLGILGVGDTDNRLKPTRVTSILSAHTIVASTGVVVIVDSLKRPWISPGNIATISSVPRPIHALEGNIKTISAGKGVAFFRNKNESLLVVGSQSLNPGSLAYLDPVSPNIGTFLNPYAIYQPFLLPYTETKFISAGSRHTLLLFSNGTATSCGGNFAGGLGRNTTLYYDPFDTSIGPLLETALPGIVPTESPVTHVKSLLRNSILVVGNRDLWTMGENRYQAGLNPQKMLADPFEINTSRFTPTKVFTFPINVTKVDASAYHGLFLMNNGTVWTYGHNLNQQLALNLTNATVETPMMIPDLDNITDIFASFDIGSAGSPILAELAASCAIRQEYNVTYQSSFVNITWTYSEWVNVTITNSTMVNGTLVNTTSEVLTMVNTTLVNTTLVVNEIRTPISRLYCWGSNAYFRFGLNHTNTLTVPTLLNQFENVSVLHAAMGNTNLLVVTELGQLWVSGLNQYGELGTGQGFPITYQVPVLVPNIKRALQVFAGEQTSYFITRCPKDRSGPNCEFVNCFGKSSADQSVCSSQGTCVNVDVCDCFTPDSGERCQFSVYSWIDGTGDWTDKNNWKVKRGQEYFDSPSYPLDGDVVLFEQLSEKPSNIYCSVSVNVVNIKISPNARLVLTIAPGVTMTTKSLINESPTGRIIFSAGSTLRTPTATFGGPVTTTNVVIDVPDITITKTGSLTTVGTISFPNTQRIDVSGSLTTNGPFSLIGTRVDCSGSIILNAAFTHSSATLILKGSLSSSSTSQVSFTSSSIQVQSGASISFGSSETILTDSVMSSEGASIQILSPFTLIRSTFDYLSGSFLFQSESNLKMTRSTLKIASAVRYQSAGSAILALGSVWDDSTVTILPSGSFIHVGSSPITGSNSKITNQGTYLMDTSSNDVRLGVAFYNEKNLTIRGSKTSYLSPFFNATSTSTLFLTNSTLDVSSGPFNVTAGIFLASGIIKTPLLTVSTQDGFFRLVAPYRLNILGSFTLADTTTVFLNLNGTDITSNDHINVNGTFILNSFVLIRLGKDFEPEVETRIPFLESKAIIQTQPDVFLFGLPYKNAEFTVDSNTAYFVIKSSFGAAAGSGYSCNYMQNQRIVEINKYTKQQKAMISLTTPQRPDMWVGFGFDYDGSLTNSLLIMAKGESVMQFNHNKTFTPQRALDAQAFTSSSVFYIPYSPLYYTINIFVPLSSITLQSKIYYAEVNNASLTNSTIGHYVETLNLELKSLEAPAYECTNFLQPTRVEVLHPAVLGVVGVLYIILFILLCLFSHFRPLVTRGVAPFMTLGFLFIQLMLEIRNYFEIPYYHASLCIYYAYGIYPLQIICFVTCYLYFLRYFSVINLNENKKNVYATLKLGKSIEKTQKLKNLFLKVVSSPWFTIGLTVLSYLLVTIVYTVILGGFGYKCRFDTLITMKVVQDAALICIYSLTIISLIVDIIPNWRMLFLRCQWIEYIFNSDPYYFRFQMLLFLPFMIGSIFVEIFNLATSTRYLDIVRFINASISLNTIVYAFLVLIIVVLPLVLTWIELLKRIGVKPSSTNILDELLGNKQTEEMFIEFCQKEFSLENVLCFQEIQQWKKTKSDPLTIYYKYLNGSQSVMEVNCQRKFCTEIFNKVKKNEYDEALFEDIEKELKTNLYDNYGRFKNSSKYLNYLKNKSKELEMIEGNTVGTFIRRGTRKQ